MQGLLGELEGSKQEEQALSLHFLTNLGMQNTYYPVAIAVGLCGFCATGTLASPVKVSSSQSPVEGC